MRELWTWSVIAALVMGVIVWGLTFWVVVFHRKKKDSPEFPVRRHTTCRWSCSTRQFRS